MIDDNTPDCAEWNIWFGDEIEGVRDIGERTLFIRKFTITIGPNDDLRFLRDKIRATRVWFCKEFKDWTMIDRISQVFGDENCSIEIEQKTWFAVPKRFRENFRVFLKVSVPLKNGDVVCVGPRFQDQAFEFGTGAKVNPEQYKKDTKIA